MSGWPVIWQVLIGLAFGSGYAYLGNRLTRPTDSGLIAKMKAKRRGEVLYAVTWTLGAVLVAETYLNEGGWWRIPMVLVDVGLAGYYVRNIMTATRLLKDPFIYLAALRDAFGGLS